MYLTPRPSILHGASGDPISKSKWLAPNELGLANHISSFKLSQPFSDQSLLKSEFQPRIGAESLRVLRGLVEREPDKIAKFTDSPQQLILRSAARSTSIKVPPYVMIYRYLAYNTFRSTSIKVPPYVIDILHLQPHETSSSGHHTSTAFPHTPPYTSLSLYYTNTPIISTSFYYTTHGHCSNTHCCQYSNTHYPVDVPQLSNTHVTPPNAAGATVGSCPCHRRRVRSTIRIVQERLEAFEGGIEAVDSVGAS